MTSPRSRHGFTIIELLIAMTILLAVIAVATTTFRRSSILLAAQSGRLEAQQNARFAVTTLDRELRMAGVGVVDVQPILVEASNTAITFNVDLVSRVPGDVGAVYVDTSADTSAVSAMRSSNRITLPGLAVTYPESTYMQPGGVISNAETISYYLVRDSSSSHTNEYLLYRRVNATAPTVVARGIRYNPTDTLFQYFKSDTLGNLQAVPMGSLPLYHKAVIHGSVADTGRYALIDSIRTVTVRLNAVYHDPRQGDVVRHLQTTIRILNAGLINRTTCGDPPIGPTTVGAVATPGDSVDAPYVTVSWTPSVDETGGEKDVERYALFRRPDTVSAFDQPFSSIPAGDSTYSFVDNNVQSGEHWIYGISAQDCTPMNSPIVTTGTIIVP
jgi:prepilin-type N-terminal cleavage/methylation domain-containing protein